MNDISYWMAFLSGVLFFFSPCFLPLLPSFLSYISGISFRDLKADPRRIHSRVVVNSLVFFIGFAVIFIIFGLSASWLGGIFFKMKLPLQKASGFIIILLGLYLIFQNKVKFFLNTKSFLPRSKPAGLLGTLLVGSIFAFSWTACATPFLAAILTVAGSQATLSRGFLLLLLFSLGLGIPFMICSFSLSLFLTLFEKTKKYLHFIEIAAGMLLIAVGGYLVWSKVF